MSDKVQKSTTYKSQNFMNIFFFRDLAEVFLYRIEKQLSKYWKKTRAQKYNYYYIFFFGKSL